MSSDPHLIDFMGEGRYKLRWTDGSYAVFQPQDEGNEQFVLQAYQWFGFSNAIAWLYETGVDEIGRHLKAAKDVGKRGFAP